MQTLMFNEKNAVLNHSEEFKKLGKKALILTGKKSAELNGSLNDVKEALEKEKLGYYVFNRVEENPSVDTCISAAKEGLREKCDFVIGIGGGSPMDAAKAAALLMGTPGAGKAELYDKSFKAAALPVAEIPTTCGTGSEVTGVSVISVPDKRTKCSLPHKIYPADALGHIFESYINTSVNDECKAAGIKGLQLWAKAGKRIFDPSAILDYDCLSEMLLAANYAGEAIKIAGTSLPHALSYRLTFEYGVQHGKGIGHFQPGYLKYADKEDRDILLSSAGFTDFDSFEAFIASRCSLNEASEKEIEEVKLRSVDEILADASRIARVPYKVDRERMLDIAGLK